jgi:opacity protein-like surface antigen
MSSPFRLFPLFLALIPASLFFLPSTSFAASSHSYYKGEVSAPEASSQRKALDEGLYVGFALGYDSYRARSNAGIAFNGDTIAADPALYANGFAGGILGGYGHYFNNLLYLGGEGFVNLTGASTHASFTDSLGNSNYNNKFSVGTSFGFGVLPGIKVNESSLFYLHLGFSCTNMEGQENIRVGTLQNNDDSNHWQTGFSYGLGLETAIYQDFSLRGQYTYTSYNSFNSPFDTVYSPSNNQFMLALIYHLY